MKIEKIIIMLTHNGTRLDYLVKLIDGTIESYTEHTITREIYNLINRYNKRVYRCKYPNNDELFEYIF